MDYLVDLIVQEVRCVSGRTVTLGLLSCLTVANMPNSLGIRSGLLCFTIALIRTVVKFSFYRSVLKESAAITKVMILFSGGWGEALTSILRSGSTGALLAKEYLIFQGTKMQKSIAKPAELETDFAIGVDPEVMYDALENMVGI